MKQENEKQGIYYFNLLLIYFNYLKLLNHIYIYGMLQKVRYRIRGVILIKTNDFYGTYGRNPLTVLEKY